MRSSILIIFLFTTLAAASGIDLWLPFEFPNYQWSCDTAASGSTSFTLQNQYTTIYTPGVTKLSDMITLAPGTWNINGTVTSLSTVRFDVPNDRNFNIYISYIIDAYASRVDFRINIRTSASSRTRFYIYTIVANETYAYVRQYTANSYVLPSDSFSLNNLKGRYVVIYFFRFYSGAAVWIEVSTSVSASGGTVTRYATPDPIIVVRPSRGQFCIGLSDNVGYMYYVLCDADRCASYNLAANATRLFEVATGRYVFLLSDSIQDALFVAHRNNSIYFSTFRDYAYVYVPQPPGEYALYDGKTACTHTLRDVTLVDGTTLDRQYSVCAERVPIWTKILYNNYVYTQPAWLATQLPTAVDTLMCSVDTLQSVYYINQVDIVDSITQLSPGTCAIVRQTTTQQQTTWTQWGGSWSGQWPGGVGDFNVWHILYVAIVLALVLTPVTAWPFAGVALVALTILLNMPTWLVAVGIIMAFTGIVKAVRQ
ncbi:MAG: hypothetical protein QXT13_07590 [Pyrobaculum sp.]